jgi:tRNA(Ile)-lysidine synthetase-like protein
MKIIKPIPPKLYLACSGGVDSVAALHFLISGRRDVSLIHINHGTPMANTYEYSVRMLSRIYDIKLDVYPIKGKTEKDWRDERYKIFESYTDPVITCHHYDDNLETMIMRKRPIPHRRGNILRPFLLARKQELIDYAIRHNLTWVEDPTNYDPDYCERNRIREAILRLRDVNYES